MKLEHKPVSDLIPYAANSRTHSDEQVTQIAASIKEFGFNNPILIDKDNGIIAGHGRLQAAKKLDLDEVPTITLEHLSDAQRRAFVIADNKLALNAGWDDVLLSAELERLDGDIDLGLLGFNDQELAELFDNDGEGYIDGVKGQMSLDFGVPPFTVLNARDGGWQKRKKYWLSCGIQSEEGRKENLIGYGDAMNTIGNGTSIFDPVLCELMYSWFSPENGLVLDPFAGGSVRGITAALLNRHYVGVDLSESQVKANRNQAESILEESDYCPTWHVGDSANIEKIVFNVQADMVMSCPPYADLEVYSDNPKDISNMDYSAFLEVYRNIIDKTYAILKDDSFAVWVVGEVRDKKGNYYNFVGDTITAFKDAGFNYYNEAILVTVAGSLPLRAGSVMRKSRKLGKSHQNILIFVKGDGKKASDRCGEIQIKIEATDQET